MTRNEAEVAMCWIDRLMNRKQWFWPIFIAAIVFWGRFGAPFLSKWF